MNRRSFLNSLVRLGAGLGASATGVGGAGLGCRGQEPTPPASDGWNSGDVLHLLPCVDHQRILLKASFRSAHERPPQLEFAGQRSAGVKTDSRGHFFSFDVGGLTPDTTYTLRLLRAGAGGPSPLCDPWPLRTFPAPDARPPSFRLLAFTCAGGPEDLYNFGFLNAYLPLAHRQRLLARALSFAPQAAVANGDHVYWDMKSKFGWAMGRSPRAWWLAGLFQRDQPVLGGDNERVLIRAFGPQIAGLYGVMFRSLPTHFLQDDHDYGENDEASDTLRTFPADLFMLDLARSTQRLYYPELLRDPATGPPSAFALPGGLSESFGVLRYGELFEGLLYDCRRFLTNHLDPAHAHAESHFVPPEIERWLLSRSTTSPCAHLAHMPSTPVLWTAGKWAEWYPDFKDDSGSLHAGPGKPYWPQGWADQHDRLLAAASARRDRSALFVSGDLHATGAGRILASNGASLAANPVLSLLSGAIGTGALGWPSRFRGQHAVPSSSLEAEEIVAPIEENGFSLLDFTPRELRVSQFRWTPEQGEDVIDTLAPFRVLSFPNPAA